MNVLEKRLLSRDDIENEYGLSRRWLELAAWRGDGPPMRRITSRMIRYDREELERWLADRRVASTSEEVI
jgi:predicted DNA-binding transcriptional regulator AlpA